MMMVLRETGCEEERWMRLAQESSGGLLRSTCRNTENDTVNEKFKCAAVQDIAFTGI
jgi:hypothetical protein